MEEKITAVWVKKYVSPSEWKNFYGQNDIYCPIRKENGKIVVGFLLTNKHLPLKEGLSGVNDEEARIMDFYRRTRNIRPFPLLEKDESYIPPESINTEEIIPEEIPF